MAKAKLPVTFEVKRRVDKKKPGKKGFFYSITASNGRNLNPADPQTRKSTVKKAIDNLIEDIKSGRYDIVDSTLKTKRTN